jgi:hypothetical protein
VAHHAGVAGSDVAYYVIANLGVGIGLLLTVPLGRYFERYATTYLSPKVAARQRRLRPYVTLIMAVLFAGIVNAVPWLFTHDISGALPVIVGVLIGWATLGIVLPVAIYLWRHRREKQSKVQREGQP